MLRFPLVLLFVLPLLASELPTAPQPVPADRQQAFLRAEPPRLDTSDWPPGPAAVPGRRIWQPARFSAWPSLVYADEARHVALDMPLITAGQIRLGWAEQVHELPVPEALIGKRHGALQPMPMAPGWHELLISVPQQGERQLGLRLVDIADPWPHTGLRAGQPVDAAGHPVVIRMPRWQSEQQRRWALFSRRPQAPTGEALVLGDPLVADNDDVFRDLPARCQLATDPLHPEAALLLAVAGLQPPYPRLLCWSPGNAALHSGTWSAEEARVFTALRLRFDALGWRPRLLVLLPPWPADPALQEQATARREWLQRQSAFLGWELLDAAVLAGPAQQANRVAEGVFTRYPRGAAQTAIRAALRAVLAP